MSGRCILRPAKISDRLVPEIDEMRHGQFNTMFIIIDDGRNRMRVYGPVHQHQRNMLFDTSAHNGIQSMGCGKYESVHIAGHKRLHNGGLIILIIIRIRQYGDIVLIRQSPLDLADNRRKKWIGQIRYDHTNRMRTTRAQPVSERAPRIAHFGRNSANSIGDRARDHRPGLGIKNTRNRGWMDFRLCGDILDIDVSFRHESAAGSATPSVY